MDCLKPGDVAIFASPLAFRWVHFACAIEKGLNVFIEKPLTANGPTSRRMIKLAQQSVAIGLKVSAGPQALAALGIELPADDFDAARKAKIDEAYRRIALASSRGLRKMQTITDAVMLAVTRVLITMGSSCYRSHQPLWSVLVPKVVNLNLRYWATARLQPYRDGRVAVLGQQRFQHHQTVSRSITGTDDQGFRESSRPQRVRPDDRQLDTSLVLPHACEQR